MSRVIGGGVAWLWMAALAVGCGGGGAAGGGDAGEGDASAGGGGGLVVVDGPTGADVGGSEDAVACTPGELVCEGSEQRVVCNEDGDGWEHAGVCNLPQVCDAETASCMGQVCAPGEPTCVAQGQGVATCNASGTGVLDDTMACEEGTSCVTDEGCRPFVCQPGELGCVEPEIVALCRADGQTWEEIAPCGGAEVCSGCASGAVSLICAGVAPGAPPVEAACGDGEVCVPVAGCTEQLCVPGEYGCKDNGVAWQCDDDGLGWTQVGKPCTETVCVQCISVDVSISCPNPSGPAVVPTDHVTCDTGSGCVKGQGCVDWKCTPGDTRCATGSVHELCAADGQAWSSDLCHPYATCMEETLSLASCVCDGSTGCDLLDTCLDLQPPATSVGWLEQKEPRLVASFRTRRGPDGDSGAVGVVQAAPVASPWTGAPLPLATELDDLGQPVTSFITLSLSVNGITRPLACAPPSAELPALVDVAFVVDVRATMADTLALLEEQVPLLAVELGEAHADARFGALFYSDVVPAEGTTATPLSSDPSGVVAALGAAQAQLTQSDLAENGVEAVAWAVDGFAWRPGAQRVVVLLQEDVMHDPVDNSGISTTAVTDVLAMVHRELQIHTVHQSQNTEAFQDPVHPDPRVFSCVTGGRTDDLASLSGWGALDVGPIGDAIAGARLCTFELEDPSIPVDLELVITATHGDLEVSDAAQRAEVDFSPP